MQSFPGARDPELLELLDDYQLLYNNLQELKRQILSIAVERYANIPGVLDPVFAELRKIAE